MALSEPRSRGYKLLKQQHPRQLFTPVLNKKSTL